MLSNQELYEIAGYQSFVDDVCQVNPFLAVQDNGGGNGEEDVQFKRMLRTEKFMVDLKADLIPKKHNRIFVIERLFVEDYENIYITWTAKMADGSVQNPFHFIGMHETSCGQRRDPEDGILWIEGISVPQASIDGFRRQGTRMLNTAQLRATANHKPVRKQLEYNGKPTELKLNG